MRLFSFLGLVVVVIGGCGVTVSDRSDFGSDDESVRVYAAGATVEFRVRGNSFFVDGAKVTATSSDDSVFTVDSAADGLIVIRTVEAGEAEIVFKQDGDVVDSRPIKVKNVADVEFSVDVKAIDADDIVPVPTELTELRVLRGRNARVTVNAKDDDGGQLFGQSVSAAVVDPVVGADGVAVEFWQTGVLADGPQSFIELAPDVDAPLEGDGDPAVLHLTVGTFVKDVALVAVDVGDIERIVLDEESADVRGPGRRSVVLARAEDKNGRQLLGAPGWTIEGKDAGVGEAVAYDVAWFSSHELRARIGDVEAVRHIDCDVDTVGAVRAGGGCAGASVGLPLVLLGMLRRRRR